MSRNREPIDSGETDAVGDAAEQRSPYQGEERVERRDETKPRRPERRPLSDLDTTDEHRAYYRRVSDAEAAEEHQHVLKVPTWAQVKAMAAVVVPTAGLIGGVIAWVLAHWVSPAVLQTTTKRVDSTLQVIIERQDTLGLWQDVAMRERQNLQRGQVITNSVLCLLTKRVAANTYESDQACHAADQIKSDLQARGIVP